MKISGDDIIHLRFIVEEGEEKSSSTDFEMRNFGSFRIPRSVELFGIVAKNSALLNDSLNTLTEKHLFFSVSPTDFIHFLTSSPKKTTTYSPL